MLVNLQTLEYDIAQFRIWPEVTTLILEPTVTEFLYGFRQLDGESTEAGGQLFGYFDKNTMVISHASSPAVADQRSRYFFKPNSKLEQIEINKQFAKGIHYFGDWHTHPEATPVPSRLDKTDFNRIVRESRKQLSSFIMIIVGTFRSQDGLFVAASNGRVLRQLKSTNV